MTFAERLERVPGPALGRIARVLLVVIGVGPFLPILLGGIPVLHTIGDLFERWFEFQCHREIARSFSIFGHVMPVCTRCFGIYAGLGLGALILRPRLAVWPLRIWVGVAAAAMVLDVATETLNMRPPSSIFRLITGLALAYPVGAAVVWAARGETQE
jgi:uncharacterized membrane protein